VLFDTDAPSDLLAEENVTETLSTRTVTARRLPAVRPTPGDPAASVIAAATLVPDAQRRLALLRNAWDAHPDSLDLPFRLAGAAIDARLPDSDVEPWLQLAAANDPNDWRANWYRGQAALLRGDGHGAEALFDAVLAEVPGELAPKLALGYASELAGDLRAAAGYFDLVSKADPGYPSASFGLARCLRAHGDRDGAVAALDRIPASSSRYEAAQVAMAELLLGASPDPAAVARASDVLEMLHGVETVRVHRLRASLLEAAAALVDDGKLRAQVGQAVLGVPLVATRLRRAAERELRACAHLAATRHERIAFVDEANRVRPLSLV
jgi:serine/threonine-protein kinase PknG